MHSSPPSVVANAPQATPPPQQAADRRGMALITALFSIVVLATVAFSAVVIAGVRSAQRKPCCGVRRSEVRQLQASRFQ